MKTDILKDRCYRTAQIMNTIKPVFQYDKDSDELRESGSCVFPHFSSTCREYWKGDIYYILFYDYLIRQLLQKYDEDFMLNLTIPRGIF